MVLSIGLRKGGLVVNLFPPLICTYGLDSYSLDSYGTHSYGLQVMVRIVMAHMVMAFSIGGGKGGACSCHEERKKQRTGM